MNVGDSVRIKDKLTVEKVGGVITEISTDVEVIDVTAGGLMFDGPPPDKWREVMPGQATTTITVRLEP